MKKRVLFYCQSLLGIGHFIRSRELLRALHEFEICFLYGGETVPGFDWPAWVQVVYLPALRSDAAFEKLYVVDGAASLAEVKAQRKELLLTTFEQFVPDILLIELFPFGRKKFQFELLPLLERARTAYPKPKIVCSLRDILVHRAAQDRYEAEASAVMNQYFDALLVHADPCVQRLEETFASVARLQCPIHYTGYVAQPAPPKPAKPSGHPPLLLVSIGGGRVGHELIHCALEASPRLPMTHHMQVFTGPHIPADEFAHLQRKADGLAHVTIQKHTTEFTAWLQQAELSLSMAGYNTCMDILSTQSRALVYPFTEHDNDEQTRRARKLAQLGLLGILETAHLSPASLTDEIMRALHKPAPSVALNLQGATRTAEILNEMGS